MRSIFVILFLLSSTAVSAEQISGAQFSKQCGGCAHNVASITRDIGPAEKPTLILKKTDRLAATPQVAERDNKIAKQLQRHFNFDF